LQLLNALPDPLLILLHVHCYFACKLLPVSVRYQELRQRLKTVFVLIFNPGQSSEGIYTLWLDDQNIVLGFECRYTCNAICQLPL
jgi:Protein of unknown function (DUF3110)